MSRYRITSHEVYATNSFYTRFLSSFTEEVARVVICAPAIDPIPQPFTNFIDFYRFLQQRSVDKIVIITRPPSCDATALPREVAQYLDGQGVDIIVHRTPKLNAKLYHLEFKKGWFRSFVGSADFNADGLQSNQELISEVEGAGTSSPTHREVARLISDRNAINYPSWNYHNLSGQAEVGI